MVDLQCCVNFCCEINFAVQQSDAHKCVLFHILFYDGLSQDIEYSSLCSTLGPCCLSTLHIVVYVC